MAFAIFHISLRFSSFVWYVNVLLLTSCCIMTCWKTTIIFGNAYQCTYMYTMTSLQTCKVACDIFGSFMIFQQVFMQCDVSRIIYISNEAQCLKIEEIYRKVVNTNNKYLTSSLQWNGFLNWLFRCEATFILNINVWERQIYSS